MLILYQRCFGIPCVCKMSKIKERLIAFLKKANAYLDASAAQLYKERGY